MPTARDPLYRRHRFPPEVISYAVWLYFRFFLSLRMVEEMLAARGIGVTYEPCASGYGNSAGRFPIGYPSAHSLAVTNSIWTKSLSRSRANNIGSGALLTRMASFSTS